MSKIKAARRADDGRLEWLTVTGWQRLCEFEDARHAVEVAKEFGQESGVELYKGDGVRELIVNQGD